MLKLSNKVSKVILMIGNPKWFKRRKYTGWGITPKTWQGWLYISLILIPFIAFQAMPFWQATTRIYVTLVWAAFLIIDAGHIMVSLDKDELEYKIEAIAERNAAWVMMSVIITGILYELISSGLKKTLRINPFLVAALFGGMIVKSVTNYVLEKKGV